MFYEPLKEDHGLAHDPFKSCVVPRPIGWISTINSKGIHNLAPYSQFQNLTSGLINSIRVPISVMSPGGFGFDGSSMVGSLQAVQSAKRHVDQ